MAIKVIKAGVIPEQREKKFSGTCSKCKCIIECSEGDLQSTGDPRDNDQYVDCPTCGNWIWPKVKVTRNAAR